MQVGATMKQQLSDAIEDFLRGMASQDYSKKSVRQYRIVLNKFLTVNGNIWCHNITERHVTRHFEVAARTRKPVSLGVDHSALSRFFEWCRHTRRMGVDTNPMYGRRKPTKVHRERNRIPADDFPRLLDLANESDPRDRALVAILIYTLIRDSEARDLRIRDLKLRTGDLSVRVFKTHLEDTMPICAELDQEMRRWLIHYESVVGPLEPHYYLLPARDTYPIREKGKIVGRRPGLYKPERPMLEAARVITPLLERSGFPTVAPDGSSLREGAHTLRRSGARALFDRLVADGYDHGLRIVQSMLHHKNQAMTEHYIGVTADRRSRDQIIRGQIMYPISGANVIPLAK
jgi:integrase